MSLIEANEVTKIYQGRSKNVVALDGLSFAQEPGEGVAVLGSTGSGKSTLFRLLAGLAEPTTGEITLNERPCADPRCRIGIGFVPEYPNFPGHLTAFGALEFAGKLSGQSAGETEGQAHVMLDRLDLAKWADTEVSKFSRDLLRRLALASALVSVPQLLIIDEPPERSDRMTRDLFARALSRAREDGITLLLLTHTLTRLEGIVERVLILDRGRIVRSVAIAELTSEKLQMEIEAEIGDRLIELPGELCQIVSVSQKRLVVELDDERDINSIIDYLRLNRITIHSIQRRKASPDSTWIGSQRSLDGVLR